MAVNAAPATASGTQAELSPAAEDYLAEIAALAERGRAVTGAALAKRLGVSPPSVTQMLGRLVRARLVAARETRVSRGPGGSLRAAGITLTPEGAARAAWLLQRRRLCERFFEVVGGLDALAAPPTADAAEHGLVESAVRRMEELLGGAQPAGTNGDPPAPGAAPLPEACARAGRVRLTAVRVEGPCASAHRAGDTFMLTRHTPAGLCGASYAALLPWIRWMFGDAPDEPGSRPQISRQTITQRCPGDGYVLWRAEALD